MHRHSASSVAAVGSTNDEAQLADSGMKRKVNLASVLGCLNSLTLIRPNEKNLLFVVKKLLQKAKRLAVAVHDPVVTMQLGEREIYIPLSHNLPNLLSEEPNYDRAVPRLCCFLSEECGYLCVIDVGANVGDTVNMIDQLVRGGAYLCIEPSRRFFELLKRNTNQIATIKLENCALGDLYSSGYSHLNESGGTARLMSGENNSDHTLTLDELLRDRHREFVHANLLKVDTDGYDFKVLRGARHLLRQAKPVLFFELSPDHLMHVGKENPMAIFDDLKDLSYSHLLFYDNEGFPVAPVRVAMDEVISGLIKYVHRRAFSYLDVLAFHADQESLFKKFLRCEWETIPVFTRPYFR